LFEHFAHPFSLFFINVLKCALALD